VCAKDPSPQAERKPATGIRLIMTFALAATAAAAAAVALLPW